MRRENDINKNILIINLYLFFIKANIIKLIEKIIKRILKIVSFKEDISKSALSNLKLELIFP